MNRNALSHVRVSVKSLPGESREISLEFQEELLYTDDLTLVNEALEG